MATKTITVTEYRDACSSSLGWCRTCQDFTTETCEPDARNRPCGACTARTAFGAEEARLRGLFEVVEADEVMDGDWE